MNQLPVPKGTKRQRTDENDYTDTGNDKLRFRVRGFRSIYNSELPLDDLERFTDRHQFSSSVSGLYYDSELIRDASMRPFWNISQATLIDRVENLRLGMKHGSGKTLGN